MEKSRKVKNRECQKKLQKTEKTYWQKIFFVHRENKCWQKRIFMYRQKMPCFFVQSVIRQNIQKTLAFLYNLTIARHEQIYTKNSLLFCAYGQYAYLPKQNVIFCETLLLRLYCKKFTNYKQGICAIGKETHCTKTMNIFIFFLLRFSWQLHPRHGIIFLPGKVWSN